MSLAELKRVNSRRLVLMCLLVMPMIRASTQVASSASSAFTANDEFERGLIALKENRFEAALENLTTAERAYPMDARIRNFRGITLVGLGHYAEAVAEYREAIRLDPKMKDAYRNLGFLEWKQHELVAAAKDLSHALDLSDDAFAHYYLGRVHLDSLRYREAFEELDRSQVPWPEDPAFLMEAATGYAALGWRDAARKTAKQATTLHLSDAQAVQAASLLLSLDDKDSAIALLGELSIDNARAKPWFQYDLALAHLIAGSYEMAASEARLYADRMKWGTEGADIGAAWSVIGIASAHLAHHDQAVEALDRAAKLSPSKEENWLNLTRELMELGRYSEAISAVQDALASNPKSYALHLRLGAAYLAADRYPEAENVFRDLVRAGDPLPTSSIGLAQVLLRTGRATEAAAELASAQQRLGPTFLISYFRGLALQRAGKSVEAASAFRNAVGMNPNNAEAHLGLGKAQLAQGHIPDATAELQQALHLDPGNVQAQRLLSQAYRRGGDVDQALTYAEASAKASATPAGDLIGDFFLPDWKMPAQSDNK